MTDSRMALGMDRLPWLPDEPSRPSARPKRGGHDLLGWAIAAILVVAGFSYWLGTRTGGENSVPQAVPGASRNATVPLPDVTRVAPSEDIQRVSPPELRPVPEPEVHRVTERPASSKASWRPLPATVPKSVADRVQRTVATEEKDRVTAAQRGAATPVAAPPNTQNVKLWPARESAGASGRVVQIGAFGSTLQAKRGWVHMSRAYPGVKRLPAVVVETRNSRGRHFYRFQIGTTSQAHSEVLCQRMQRIGFSCAVVGLPGAKKAVER
jgi:hypothetical protein